MKKISYYKGFKYVWISLIAFMSPVLLLAQSQYDYYDDDAVAGGVDGAINGIIWTVLVVVFVFICGLVFGFLQQIYYWFNPEADPKYKQGKAIEIKEREHNRKHEEYVIEQRQKATPKAIDLGLSVKWADFNLWSYKPSDIGKNFHWTDNKSIYQAEYGKINVNAIGDISGNPEYDIATKKLGSKWRMPTAEECKELIECCTWEKKIIDNIEGRLITGPNGNCIFLPFNKTNCDNEHYGEYWTSTPTFTSSYRNAQNLLFGLKAKEPAEIGSTPADIDVLGIRAVYSDKLKEYSKEKEESEIKNTFAKISQLQQKDEELYNSYKEQCIIKEEEISGHLMGRVFYDEGKTIKDEYGVIYSLDGKRLLDASECDCATYSIKDGVEFICEGALRKSFIQSLVEKNKRNLWKIILPPSLKYIHESAIPDICQMESKSKNYLIINELLIDTRKKCVVKCLNKYVQEVVIYEPIEEIGSKAFINCDVLRKVTLPNSIRIIGENSFRNGKMLMKINLPDSIEIIHEDAFWGCDSLNISRLPNKLNYIGNSAFSWTSMHNVVIPGGVHFIGNAPFPKNCINLQSQSEKYIIENGLLIDKWNLSIIQLIDSTLTTTTIPHNIKKICSNAFHHCDIETISIPSDIIDMGSGVFWGCKNLKKIVFEGNIPCIPRIAFSYCESLTSIIIPHGVENIETAAFDNCKLLQFVTLNDDLKKISSCAFIDCPNLTYIKIPESVEVLGEINKYNPHFFRECPNLREMYYDAKESYITGIPSCITKLTIGVHVEVLPSSLISRYSNVESLTIPENVRKVSKDCITNCSKLHEIYILSKDLLLEDGWINNCDNLKKIWIPADTYELMLPQLPHNENLKIKKIYTHHFLFFKW